MAELKIRNGGSMPPFLMLKTTFFAQAGTQQKKDA
jgi:hypothetical protein